jgi:S1-C subfamily serine protease
MLTLTPDLTEQLKNDPNAPVIADVNGVLVMQVIPNSPAASAGLRQGDVITQIAGQKITTAEQLQNVVEKSKINQPLKVTVQRNNQTQELTIRPGELQEAATR